MNFYVIDSKQKPILSGKLCQALNLVQRVHNIRADTDLKELLDQQPDLQSASEAMPRQPAALLPKIRRKGEL